MCGQNARFARRKNATARWCGPSPHFVRIGHGTDLDYHSGPQASLQYDENLVGRNIADLHVTGSAGYRLDLLRHVIETGEVVSEEFRVEARGRTLDLESRVVQSGDDEAVVFFRDVSERRQAEEALRRSEERYRTIVEDAADWIWILDRDDEGMFRLSFVNESYVQATGRSKDDVQGVRIDDLGRWRSARPALENLQIAIDRGEPISYEQYTGTLSGDIRISVRMTPLFNPDGEVADRSSW
ncbi:MAG: PAS domain S-box protein [Dehalococcoidia bacterium]|nr:PAS domain S-box protein [Dehalococcoidia bacterium]